VQWAGLLLGPVAAAIVLLVLPEAYRAADGTTTPLTPAAQVTAATAAWMAVWWLTEAVHVSVTALLPIAVLPILGARTVEEATAPYAHPLIFLFLGGFLLALSMQKWGLDRRIALLTLRVVGDRPRWIVAGMMLATAVMSMWVSNTATVAMMLPIALSVVALVDRVRGAWGDEGAQARFAVALLLGIAYGASIGGTGTIIGTPPNLFVVSFIRERFGHDISFVQWMMLAMPLVAVFLPVGWLLLTRVLYPVPAGRLPGGAAAARQQYRALGPAGRGEWATFAVFVVTAVAWITRPLLVDLELLGVRPLAGLTDTGIAVVAGLALFVIPVRPRERVFVMDWDTARGLPWGILLLFGGGLSLAAAIDESGVSAYLGHQAAMVGVVPTLLLVVGVTAAVVMLTELTSNTATTAALVPILAAVAPSLGVHPYVLIVPVALAASAAFMMPVATPPNAIVFGSGQVTMPQMMRAGLAMNLISIALVTATAVLLVPLVLGTGG
jgi:solute carrier family 13 (sodium-dependent dicarboxylate transporter), member 2/3/5